MATVDLRIVCVLGVLCGGVPLRAAPASVTYDQRQQGEFNLQVDVNDVALVLLPGGDFAQRNAQLKLADRVQQIFGRRAGSAESRKKYKKPANCTATATATATATKPEEATGEYGPGAAGSTATATTYPETISAAAIGAGQGNDVERVPVGAHDNGKPAIVDYDPYSVTPDTPDIFETALRSGHWTAGHAAVETVTVKTVQDRTEGPATDAGEKQRNATNVPAQSSDVKTADAPSKTVNEPVKAADPNSKTTVAGETDPAEMVAVKTVRKPAETMGSVNASDANNAAAAARVQSTKTAVTPVADGPVEMVAVKTMEKPTFTDALKVADDKSTAKTDDVVPAAVTSVQNSNKKPTEMLAVKTMEKPTSADTLKAAAKKPTDARVAVKDVQVTETDVTSTSVSLNNKKPAAETVAVKTVEKPIVAAAAAETSKAVKKPAVNTAKTAVAGVRDTSADSNGKPAAETVAVKMVEKPIVAAAAAETSKVVKNPVDTTKTAEAEILSNAADATGKTEGAITTSTKPVEIRAENEKTPRPSDVADTNVVSRSAPKVTEMVAVKTMENPATVTTAKSVTSVKTVMKTGSSSKTTHSSNGSSILRKVGDRKPLPLITLDVVPPEVVQ